MAFEFNLNLLATLVEFILENLGIGFAFFFLFYPLHSSYLQIVVSV
jgi:hypothetical protein